jgi:hypothetical protein
LSFEQETKKELYETNSKWKWLLLLSAVMGVVGCTDYYGTYQAYGRPYYGRYGGYGYSQPAYGYGYPYTGYGYSSGYGYPYAGYGYSSGAGYRYGNQGYRYRSNQGYHGNNQGYRYRNHRIQGERTLPRRRGE